MNQRLLSANWNELRFRAVMVCCWDTHFEWGMIKQLSPVPSPVSYCSALGEQPELLRETTVRCRIHVVREMAVLNGQRSTLYFWGVFDLKECFNVWSQRWRGKNPQKNGNRCFCVFLGESPTLTCPGLELSQTITSSSVAISGGLSFTSSTWTVTGTWLRRLGLSEAEKEKKKRQKR